MYEIIVTEKPAAAEKIANALADKKVTKKTNKKVSYYEITHNGKKIIVTCAVGHLFTIHEKNLLVNDCLHGVLHHCNNLSISPTNRSIQRFRKTFH